ncbi:MAG: dynamin family protein [Candidatus Hydrogenedentales bacterium]
MILSMVSMSAGVHLLQPVSSSIVIGLSEAHNRGTRLGQAAAVSTTFTALGTGMVWFFMDRSAPQYSTTFFCAAAVFLCGGIIYSLMHIPHLHQPRQRLVFRPQYRLYYLLEFLSGARKQNFDFIIENAGVSPDNFAFIREEFQDAPSGCDGKKPVISASIFDTEQSSPPRDMSLANRVIQECQENVLAHLSMLQNVLDKCRPTGSGKYALASAEEIDKYVCQIQEEKAKVDQLRMTLAVIGPMKAGKSTLINAIVGAEVLPSRSGAMTTMPTLITHVDGCKEPVLKFLKPEPFNNTIAAIAKMKFSLKERDGDDYIGTLERIRSGKLTEIHTEYRGEAQIADFMTDLNDLVRISQLPEFDLPSPLESYSQIDDFPEIEVEFISLTNRVSNTLGKLTLIDTPGPNEAGQGHLKGVVKQQLQQAAAIVVVVAPTQKDGEAFAEIRSWVHNARVHNGVPLYVFLNKFDEMSAAERKKDNGAALCQRLFPDIPLEDGTVLTVEGCTFPTCAFPALLANKAIRSLENNGKLPDQADSSWVMDFAEQAFGMVLAEKKLKQGGHRDFLEGSNILWQRSFMDSPLKSVVSASLYRAAPLCLDSAVDKIAATGKFFEDQAKGQRTSLTQSLDTLQSTIRTMNGYLEDLRKAQAKLQVIVGSAVDTIGKKLNTELDALQSSAESMVKALAKQKGRELDAQEKIKKDQERSTLDVFIDIFPKSKKSDSINKVFTGNEVLEFSSQDDAEQFSREISDSLNAKMRKTLQAMADGLEPIVLKEQEYLAKKIEAHISPIVKAIADETKDTFDINLTPPKINLPRLYLDLDIISCVNIDKKTIRKSYTERRLCTLFLYKHKVEYVDDVYKVDPREIRKSIVEMFKGKIKDLQEDVNAFIGNKFSETMGEYFQGLEVNVSQVRSIAEAGIENKKLDQQAQKQAKQQWQDTEEELQDFGASVSHTKNKLKDVEV